MKTGDYHPAVTVAWEDQKSKWAGLDCKNFCQRTQFKLPTEAQWEYACRAGTTSTYYWGKDWNLTFINSASHWAGKDLSDYAAWQRFGFEQKWQQAGFGTTPVGYFNRPNSWGLHDMLGNVSEWCLDFCEWSKMPDDGKYQVITDTYSDNLLDPLCNKGARLVVRGGCWSNYARFCRPACRYSDEPGNRWNLLGFRCLSPLN